jgi:uncharacterized membrane protein (GlpM family)
MVDTQNVVAGLIPAEPTFTSEMFHLIVTDLGKDAAFAEVIISVM